MMRIKRNAAICGEQLDFRFIGENKVCSTTSHQTSLSHVQKHQYSRVLGQMDKRSSHGMILPSELQLEHAHFFFLYCRSQLLGKLLR